MISQTGISISRVKIFLNNPLVVIQENEARLKLPGLPIAQRKHRDASPSLNLSSLRKYSSMLQDDDYLISKNSPRTVMKQKVKEMPIFKASRNFDLSSNYLGS